MVGEGEGKPKCIPAGKPEAANDAAPEKQDVAVAVTVSDSAAGVTVTPPQEGVA